MRVKASNGSHEVLMDYPVQPDERCEGLTPLQMLLASLAACSANSLMLVLRRRLNQPVTGLEVEVRALRTEQHPTVLTEIALEFQVHGNGVAPEAVEKAMKISEDQLCPVWNMLKAGTPITSSFRMVEA
jgi:putative redox protein